MLSRRSPAIGRVRRGVQNSSRSLRSQATTYMLPGGFRTKMAGHGIRRMTSAGRFMDIGSVFRRSFHVISPVFLAYYLLPESLGGGITLTGVVLLFVGTAACIEVARSALGIPLLGMRPYEGTRVDRKSVV